MYININIYIYIYILPGLAKPSKAGPGRAGEREERICPRGKKTRHIKTSKICVLL